MSLPPARSRAGYVSVCQQLLSLGVVLAVLTPAASVLSLDVVRETPASSAVSLPGAGPAPTPDPTPGPTLRTATVPTGPVETEVEYHQLTTPESARVAPGGLEARARVAGGTTRLRSKPLPVQDFATVGVTWAPGADLDHDAVGVRYREPDGTWSAWTQADVDEDHGPDTGTREAATVRSGTEAVVVGETDAVQVRVDSSVVVPADLRAVVIEPGAAEVVSERPATDLAAERGQASGSASAQDGLVLSAAGSAARPEIFSRAQWGAVEGMRSGSPSYGRVNAGFVHHTVTANVYDREDVPGIIRSIYAYHTRSLGWSDIGYNFLVDRFGRIWEGRYGGVARAVVGAQVLNYNSVSFGMSALGNYDVVQPTEAMVAAFSRLSAWKLGIHGVPADALRVQVGATVEAAISGHRDAGSTVCPGRYLYSQLGEIRRRAALLQKAGTAPQPAPPAPQPEPEPVPQPKVASLDSDLVGDAHPDLVVRRARDQQAVIVPTGGLTDFGPAVRVAGDWAAWPEATLSPDLTGDGRADLLLRRASGATAVAAGRGGGTFATPVPTVGGPGAEHDLVVPVGDADGDGYHDLVARRGKGRLVVFLGGRTGEFVQQQLGVGWARFSSLVPAGDLTGDGDPDLLGQQTDGTLWLRAGKPGAHYTAARAVPGTFSPGDVLAPAGDLTRDGLADLVLHRAADNTTVVLPGRGDGTFGQGLGRLSRVRDGRGLTGGVQVGGSARPDLIARRGDRLVWLADQGTTETLPPVETGVDLSTSSLVLNAGDWDGDGHGDLITRRQRALLLHTGDGAGAFAEPVRLGRGFAAVQGLQAVGDVTGDGRADLTGRRDGTLRVYPGAGADGIGAPVPPGAVGDPRDGVEPGAYGSLVQVSDLRGKGRADLVGTDAAGRVWLLPMTRRGVGERVLLAQGWASTDRLG